MRPAAADLTAEKVPFRKVHDNWIADNDDGQRVYDLYMKLIDGYRSGG